MTSKVEPLGGTDVRFEACGFVSASLVAVSLCPRYARA